MENIQALALIIFVSLIWFAKAIIQTYLEYRVSIHRIDTDHTVASRYWEMIYGELKQQKAFNDQMLALLNSSVTKTESGQ